MSLAKFGGGIFMIILAVGLFLFAVPISLFLPNGYIWIIAFIIVSIILAITGIYYTIKGIVDMTKETPIKHEKIDHKEEAVPKPEKKLEKEKIVKVIICPGCKNENKENAKFCDSCGKKLI